MKKIRIGIVGLGGIAKRVHLPVLSTFDDVEIAAGVEVNEIQAERVRKLFNIPAVYNTDEEMYGKEDLDAVYICSPNFLHKQHVTRALEAGVHVFCEKPMGQSAEEAEEMIRSAHDNEKILTPGFNMRFIENFLAAREIIQSGILGKTLQIQGLFLNPGPYNSWDPKSDWYFEKNKYGVLYDIGPHLIDLLLFLTSEDLDNIQVSSISTMKGYNIPDNIACSFTTNSNVIGSMNIGWRNARYTVQIQVHGTAGGLIVSPNHLETVNPSTDPIDRMMGYFRNGINVFRTGVKTALRGGKPDTMFFDETRIFLESVAGRRKPLLTGADGMRVLEVLDAMKEQLG